MLPERTLQATLAHLEQEIDGYVAASFVHLTSGRTLAAHCVRPDYPLGALSGHGRAQLERQRQALTAAESPEQIEELLVTTSAYFHLHAIVAAEVALYVVVSRAETTLAFVKSVIQRRTDALKVLEDNEQIGAA